MTKDDLPPLPLFSNTPILQAAFESMTKDYALAAIAAHDAKREKVLMTKEPHTGRWDEAHIFEKDGARDPEYEYAWAYIEREGA